MKLKYIESLWKQDFDQSIALLKDHLSKFERFTAEVEELSQLILCSNQMELTETLNFNINSMKDRKRLLIQLNKKIKPPNYMESNRLEQLVTQAVKYQVVQSKLYHPALITEFPSLQEDYVPPPPTLPATVIDQCRDMEDEVWLLQLSNDQKKLAAVGANKRLVVYLFDREKLTKQYSVDSIHALEVNDCIWNFDDTRIITCSKDNSIKIWMYEDGKLFAHIEDAHQNNVTSLCRLNGTKDIYSSSSDGCICLWDSVGNKKYSLNSLRVKYLMTSADGKLLYAVSGMNNIVVFNVDTKEETALLYENDEIQFACTNRRGDKIMTNTSLKNPEIHVWSVEKKCIERRYSGHTQDRFVTPCIFGGRFEELVISGSNKGSIFIWHMNLSLPIRHIPAHKLQINNLAMVCNHERYYLFSSADDGSIVLLSS